MTHDMHAVILAGGKGVRLRPYTTSLPKPLVPIGGEYAILEIVLIQLAHERFSRVTIAIGHLGHLIRSFVGDGSRWGISVDYVNEESPLGTFGPLLGIVDDLPEHVLVMNGDVLTNLPYGRLLRDHAAGSAPLTIATFERTVKIDFGVLHVDASTVTGFKEKPTLDYRVSMGVYGLTTETLRRYPAGQPFGFDDLVLDLLDIGDPPTSYAFEGYWLDIGRPDDYDRANDTFDELKHILLPSLNNRVIQLPDNSSVESAQSEAWRAAERTAVG
jgi:NDP-sugar pyrophosphorylase family protein